MNKIIICFIIATTGIFQSCSKGVAIDPVSPQTGINRDKVLAGYATLVSVSYEDALITATTLQTTLTAFIAAPSEQGLEDAKDAWINAKNVYSQTETYQFFKDPQNPITALESTINSWPLEGAYIDYVPTDETSGIINSTTFGTITKDKILAANQEGSQSNVACGYHAIEFLLWGQYTSSGAGERAYTDYVLTADSTHLNPKRRGDYLLAATSLLVDNLTVLTTAWKAGAQNYRAGFIKNGNPALLDILTGMAKYGKEALSTNMSDALASHNPKDGESCFSNQTHNDIYYGQLGIANIYKGSYQTTVNTTYTVYSIENMLNGMDATQNATMLGDFTATEDAAGPILINEHFDLMIADGNAGNVLIQNTITALINQSEKLVPIALKLTGLELK